MKKLISHRPYIILLTVLSLIILTLSNVAAARIETPPSGGAGDPSSATASKLLSAPELIEQDFASGKITEEQELLYLAYALNDYEKLPIQYHSQVPWDGTMVALKLHNASALDFSIEVQNAVKAATSGSCAGSSASLPNLRDTTHFHIEYDTIAGGLTIDDYATSFETAWSTEVTQFGWSAPPVLASNPAPGNRYHVRIDALDSDKYGVTSIDGTHAGLVGDNPNTSWNDIDASASCIVINRNLSGFWSTTQASLDATTAHEFNHSIQFGYGVLSGDNIPDSVFIEGAASWIEDEVYDNANDNVQYLWPDFTMSMGQYTKSPYPFWFAFRGLTERFGSGTANGSEQVMQDFFEETSKSSTSNMLAALNTALTHKGTNLADAYHAYSIAAKFIKPCNGSYTYPYCFEEATNYLNHKSLPAVNGIISNIGGSFSGTVQDNYALNWVQLPTSKPYSIAFQNTSSKGQFRISIVADTGKTLEITKFPSIVVGNEKSVIDEYNPPVGAKSVVAVITNQEQTADNPLSSSADPYKIITTRPIDFIIDDTGSMADDIDQVKVVVNQKIDEFASKSVFPLYHLLTYKDDVNYRGATTSTDTIKSWVNGLSATGGDDCPEEMLGALNRIAQESPHSEGWVLSDAGFHGGVGDLTNTIYNLVKAGVTVHPIIYGLCFDSASSSSSVGGQEAGTCTPQVTAAESLGINSFVQLANETGGHFFQISASETQGAAAILLNEMITSADISTNTDHVTSGSPKIYNVQIDDTMQEANFLLNGFSGSTSLVLLKPNGSQVVSTDPDVTYTGISNAQYYHIVLPAAGIWQAQVNGDGDFAFSASGNTPINFDYLSDTSLPQNKPTNVQALLTGPIASATFKFTHPDGSSPEPVELFDDGSHDDYAEGDGIYGGIWTPTDSGNFYFRVEGTTNGAVAFEQVVTKIIRIQNLNVEAPPDLEVQAGASTLEDFAISNVGGTSDTYSLTYSSTHGWADASSLPASVTIEAGLTTHVQIPINIPSGAAPGTTDITTLVAVSQTNALINDAGSVVITVKPGSKVYLPVVKRAVLPGSFNKVSPLNGVTQQSLNLNLDWDDSVGATSYAYCYDTTNDNTCSTWLNTGSTSEVFISGLNYDMTYYWQVKATNGDGDTFADGSASAHFAFRTMMEPLPAPQQITPLDGTIFYHYPRTTSLVWFPVAGASGYEVAVEFCTPEDWNICYSYPIVTLGSLQTTYTFDFVGAQPGRWRVWAINADGSDGLKSGWSYFRYTQ